ncbi:class I SAM-dependent methyltransferase [Paenibacillus sp. NPDC058071]|uniref:class I SAM-dependent methyltransferase n=1 Tax=Paenibacillus sp. NPDC058071 TaxID=3346326 RepID=UPI0036DF7C76
MDNTQRFSDRAGLYVKYRPSYPKQALDFLYEQIGFHASSTIADIGSGTGIFSSLLLERGSEVIAVEPNEAMRAEAEGALLVREGYRSVAAAAESTGLSDASVDFIVCAQSFHWFDRSAAKTEFHRILKPGGKVALIWNSRLTEGTPFLDGYDRLLRTYGIDYEHVSHKNIAPVDLRSFFLEEGEGMQIASFDFAQLLNEEELLGRMLSSSYMPLAGHPHHEPLLAELKLLFQNTSKDGRVSFDYRTELFWGEV